MIARAILRAVGDDRARDLARAFELRRGDLRAFPLAVVAEFGLFGRRGHSLSPFGFESAATSVRSVSPSGHPRRLRRGDPVYGETVGVRGNLRELGVRNIPLTRSIARQHRCAFSPP